jgi:hypothetical protein
MTRVRDCAPGRASNAGPVQSANCPKCGTHAYQMVQDCMDCHSGPICDRCPGVEQVGQELQCAECAREAQEEGL